MANLKLSLAITRQSAHPADHRRARQNRRHRFHPDRARSGGNVLAAITLRRVRRFRNVDVGADDDPRAAATNGSSAYRYSRRGASTIPAFSVRKDAKIDSPADLKGKRIGVPEYIQTSALWTRGVLEDEFGVAAKDMIFFMERLPARSHAGAIGFKPPPGVTINQIPSDKSIGSMVVSGELDGCMSYIPQAVRPRSIAAPPISTTIPTSSRCLPIPPPKVCAITAKPASFRSITAWWSNARCSSRTLGGDQHPQSVQRGQRHRRRRAARACCLSFRNRPGAAGISQGAGDADHHARNQRQSHRRSKRRQNIQTSRA